MLRKIWFVCVLFCLFTDSYGQLLWKVTNKKSKKISYLYGTIHVADERAFVLKDKLLEKIGACEVYAGEMIFDPQMIFAVLPKLFMGQDTTLQTLLTDEEYKIVKNILDEKLGMMSSMVERMKPVFTSLLLQEGKMGGTPSNKSKQGYKPLDLFLQEEADKRKLELVGLETLEEQMNVFDLMPVQKQAKALYEEIVNSPQDTTSTTNMDKMLDWYAVQKLDSLYLYAAEEFKEDPNLGYAILTKRNQNMAERIEDIILKKSAFIAIGAAHLPDVQGVIELLRKRKFKVEPIKK